MWLFPLRAFNEETKGRAFIRCCDTGGKIDMNLVQTGKSVIQRKLQEDLSREIMNVLKDQTSDSMSFNELIKQINEHSQDRVESSDIQEALSRLQQEDKVIVLGEGVRRSVRLNNRV